MTAGMITAASTKQIDRIMMIIVAAVISVVLPLIPASGRVSARVEAAVVVAPAYTIITVPH